MTNRVWRCGAAEMRLGERTHVMGIVNATPDSFSDGGVNLDPETAVKNALRMVADGADIVDVGGESTRPGSAAVEPGVEMARVLPVVEGIASQDPTVLISIDTRRTEVAHEALQAGARIVNDVSAGAEEGMFQVVGDAGAGMVLMHMGGDPETMQIAPHYEDVVAEVREFLGERVEAAVSAGIPRERLAVDPGIGFGKDLEHNLALLRDVRQLADLGVAVLVGPSRKRFIGVLTGVEEPAARVDGTEAAVAWCATQGVDVVRVHDVKEMVRVLLVIDAIARDGPRGRRG